MCASLKPCFASATDLRQAVSLLDGDFLEGIDVKEPTWEDWLSDERRRIGNLACGALVRLGRLELDEGRAADALGHAEACIRRDIFREDAHRLAIQAFAALGRRAEALKHYQNFAERLMQELGTAPESETVKVYDLVRTGAGVRDEILSLAPVRKPSIAVLPFTNLSNEPEQDYFIDGMVDEIISALSRLHWLFVIARSSLYLQGSNCRREAGRARNGRALRARRQRPKGRQSPADQRPVDRCNDRHGPVG
jgi:tetratricopeptide (TPR) repeat protein